MTEPAYTRDSVPALRGPGLVRYPVAGTIIEDPDTNPAFILRQLIRVILDIADVLTADECIVMTKAEAAAHFWELVQPAPSSIEERTDGTLMLMDTLIMLYNAKSKEHGPYATMLVVLDYGCEQARHLQFVDKKWYGHHIGGQDDNSNSRSSSPRTR